MARRDSILKYVTKQHLGIEVGPWFNPMAPKRDGYNCRVLDVFDDVTLRQRAAAYLGATAEAIHAIEDVDFVGSSTHIDEVVSRYEPIGGFDYVVSSHNFEHLPNPIRFLQGCAKVLKQDGIVSMAIPDHRACFDYFRPVTMLPEWIDAFLQEREQPTLAQDFAHRAFFAWYCADEKREMSFFRGAVPSRIFGPSDLRQVFDEWMERERAQNTEYHDAHCSVFTPSSFEFLIRDAAYLGLVPFEIVEIIDAGSEFYAHLKLKGLPTDPHAQDHEDLRNGLLRKIQDEEAERSTVYQRLESAQRKIEQLEVAIDGLRKSTSWRLTSPMRRLVSTIRGVI